MLEKALRGSPRYWSLLAVLGVLVLIGGLNWVTQYREGLGITGLSRFVPWGFYIAQFTFMVGVAASAVMVVLPYYLHDYKAFSRITILGEFVAIPSVLVCMAFVGVDIGQPARFPNLFLYPTPNSVMMWDIVALFGYLILNIIISMVTFGAERKGVAPPKWIKPVIFLSIPWAVSIHTVTAFLYSGLAARPFWLTAILAPRFLASAFAAGPALLLLLCMAVRRFTDFDPGEQAMQTLRKIVTYAMVISVFFVGLELFTALYSDMPHHVHHFEYMFFGLKDASGTVHASLAPWMWASAILSILALVILFSPGAKKIGSWLAFGCVTVFVSLWIEKGLGLVVTGFVPTPLNKVVDYTPTLPELSIGISIYAFGAIVLLGLFKIAITVKEDLEA